MGTGGRPDDMERWGMSAILKEASRVLRKHHSLFLPFFLAFYLPSSIAAVLQTVFLLPNPQQVIIARVVVKGSVPSPAQGIDTADGPWSATIAVWTLSLALSVWETLGVAGMTYITASTYTPTDSDDANRSIVPRVFKSLPYAFLRVFVTQLWILTIFMVIYLVSILIGGVLYAIASAVAGWSDPFVLVAFAAIPILAGYIYLIIMFTFAGYIAVLEPGNYGREALKRSTKLVRVGGAGTVVAIVLASTLVSLVSFSPIQSLATGTMPAWEKGILAVAIGVWNSFLGLYLGIASVVMYFVYKLRFEVATSGIPVFNRTNSADQPYNPLVPGNDVAISAK